MFSSFPPIPKKLSFQTGCHVAQCQLPWQSQNTANKVVAASQYRLLQLVYPGKLEVGGWLRVSF